MMVVLPILLCCEVLHYIEHTMNLNPYIRNKNLIKTGYEPQVCFKNTILSHITYNSAQKAATLLETTFQLLYYILSTNHMATTRCMSVWSRQPAECQTKH